MRSCGDAKPGRAPGGGRVREAAVGEGRGGRAAEGGGPVRCPRAEHASGSRALAALCPFCRGSPPPSRLPPANQNKAEDLPLRGGFHL